MAANYNGLVTPLAVIDADNGLKPSLEYTYGPYNSIDEAYNNLINKFGATNIPIGLTVGIINGTTITEYWFNGGTAKANLVKKQSSGTGGGVTILTIDGITEDTNTNLNSLFPNANVGDHIIDTANGALYLLYQEGMWFKMVGETLTDHAPVVARIVNANILSYK